MSDQAIEVVVLIVAYNNRGVLADCLNSVLASVDERFKTRVVVVDNNSPDGSGPFVAAHFPRVDLIESAANLGYAGGGNLGWRHIAAAYPNSRYLALLNADTIATPGWLSALARHLEHHPRVGAVQPKLRLHPRSEQINTAGNRSHFLGFGLMTGWGERDLGQYDQTRTIDFASGAAVMVRTDLLRRVELFDEGMFMYLEDMDLSWKLRLIGYEIAFVPDAVIYHRYELESTLRAYRYLERNRWWLLLSYYKWRTLIMIGPALGLMELGMLVFAVRRGLLREKLQSCCGFFRDRSWQRLKAKRRSIQSCRVIGDRQFMAGFTGTIDFPPINRGLMRYVGNPLLAGYWWLVRRLIFW